jgi:hypothetical protein
MDEALKDLQIANTRIKTALQKINDVTLTGIDKLIQNSLSQEKNLKQDVQKLQSENKMLLEKNKSAAKLVLAIKDKEKGKIKINDKARNLKQNTCK